MNYLLWLCCLPNSVIFTAKWDRFSLNIFGLFGFAMSSYSSCSHTGPLSISQIFSFPLCTITTSGISPFFFEKGLILLGNLSKFPSFPCLNCKRLKPMTWPGPGPDGGRVYKKTATGLHRHILTPDYPWDDVGQDGVFKHLFHSDNAKRDWTKSNSAYHESSPRLVHNWIIRCGTNWPPSNHCVGDDNVFA